MKVIDESFILDKQKQMQKDALKAFNNNTTASLLDAGEDMDVDDRFYAVLSTTNPESKRYQAWLDIEVEGEHSARIVDVVNASTYKAALNKLSSKLKKVLEKSERRLDDARNDFRARGKRPIDEDDEFPRALKHNGCMYVRVD